MSDLAGNIGKLNGYLARLREKGAKLTSGFCWRYNVRNRALYERVLGGAIGDLQVAYSTYLT